MEKNFAAKEIDNIKTNLFYEQVIFDICVIS